MMKIDKSVDAPIFGVTSQNSDVILLVGDSSGGTFTSRINPLKGALVWDRASYFISRLAVAGGATGGSYSLTLETDVVKGYTALPIARVAVGPNSASELEFTKLHGGPGSPLPTQLNINQTAAGGALTCIVNVVAKQYRGTLAHAPANTAERVIMGDLIRGNSAHQFSGDEGVSADTTFVLGTSGSDLGMGRMRMWDTAFFWAVAGNTVAGGHDADVVGTVAGETFSVASTGVAGVISAANERVALASKFDGASVNPSQIIWTEVSAGGVSDFRIVALAKSGRGTMGKR